MKTGSGIYLAVLGLIGGQFGAQVVADEEFTTAFEETMMRLLPQAVDSYEIEAIYTIGEALLSKEDGSYIPPGILDGMGSWRVNIDTVRVYSNHELRNQQGYPYPACADPLCTSTFNLTGARVSFYDFDIDTLKIKDSGLAYKYIYGADGNLLTDTSTLRNAGFTRFCSAQFVDAHEYGFQRGIEDKIYFGPEETGGSFDPFGGAYWALDAENEDFWQVPALARGAWESLTQIDTESTEYVAFILPDDTSPFDADGDGELEASPLYLYVGKKNRFTTDFLDKNGLRTGKMYVWSSAIESINSPETFSGTGNTLAGDWVEIDNSQQPEFASNDGSTGFDFDGYPTQRNLWVQARDAKAFKFSRPEDITTFSRSPNEFVLISTGIGGFNGADRFGTLYTMKVLFTEDGEPLPSVLEILNDADSDPERKLRSPDNLDAADNGLLYINEDRAIRQNPDDDLEDLFGPTAVNLNEAQIVRINPDGAEQNVFQIAEVDRAVVLDPTVEGGIGVDLDEGDTGAWESSGVLDVSINFGREPGTLFIFNIQAHGIDDQPVPSRINDFDLVEGGQLLFLKVRERDDGDNGAATQGMGMMAASLVLAVAAYLL